MTDKIISLVHKLPTGDTVQAALEELLASEDMKTGRWSQAAIILMDDSENSAVDATLVVRTGLGFLGLLSIVQGITLENMGFTGG
jgi:hypothetical protein